MTQLAIGITGTGSCIPAAAVGNAQIAALLDTRPDAIERVTGIRERRLRDGRENIYVMGAIAGLRALADAGLTPADIDAIYFGGDPSGELLVPAAATIIQQLMGFPALRAADGGKAPNFCPACDVIGGCCASLFAIDAAVGRILAGRTLRGRLDAKILVIAGDCPSNGLDWRDRESAMLFADGCGAAVIEDLAVATPRPGVLAENTLDESRRNGVLALHTASDGSKSDIIAMFSVNTAPAIPARPADEQRVARPFLRMKGAEVYRHAVRRLTASLNTALHQAGLTRADVDLFIPHQANLTILKAVFGDLIDADVENEGLRFRVYTRGVVREGNSSAGTLLTALDRLHRGGHLNPGSVLALPTFGAGLSWGTLILRWHKPARARIAWSELDSQLQREAASRVAALFDEYAALVEKLRSPVAPPA